MNSVKYVLLLAVITALAGCAEQHDQLMPTDTVALQGQDVKTVQAPSDGQVSVYDVSADKLVYSGTIHKGQLLVIDPVAKNVTIDGRIANSKPMYGGESLKIQFDETK